MLLRSDRWSVPGSADSEHYHLANVHGESVFRAIHDVQRYRAQHGHTSRQRVKQTHTSLFLITFYTQYSAVTFPLQRVHIWENVLPAAYGHTAVFVLPEAKAGVRREGRHHQGSDGHRQAGHCMEDQSWRKREATDQSAAKNGILIC